MAKHLVGSLVVVGTLVASPEAAALSGCGTTYSPTLWERVATRLGISAWREEFERRDGWAFRGRWDLEKAEATGISLRQLEQNAFWDDGDDAVLDMRVDIPDSAVKALPFDFHFEAVRCFYATADGLPRGEQVASGTFHVLRAVSRGFVVRYVVTCGGRTFERVAIMESVDVHRDGVWPYSKVLPGESWQEKLAQTVEDAWNGLW